MRDPEKPQQIIEAAIRVFARTGYYSSRVSDIAREAGIASGTIYLYFKTKEEILVTLFREKMAEFVAYLRREIADERDPEAKLRRLVALHFTVLEQNPALAEVVQIELRQGHKFFRGADERAERRQRALGHHHRRRRQDLLRRRRSRLRVLGRRRRSLHSLRQQRDAQDRALPQAGDRRHQRPRHGRRLRDRHGLPP